jgi:hypothetical protein
VQIKKIDEEEKEKNEKEKERKNGRKNICMRKREKYECV